MNNTNDPHYRKLKQIKDEIVELKQSSLYTYRTENHYHPVIGEGDHYAKIMFIGEAPGENEAKQGRPFCGAAGRILDELLASINLDRKNVYVTNIVKDRPPENRDPLPAEIELYAPFLDRQIEIIQPLVIATLGRFSMKYIMERFQLFMEVGPISKIHGQIFKVETDWGETNIIPFLHPAVALYSGSQKGVLLEDFQVLRSFRT